MIVCFVCFFTLVSGLANIGFVAVNKTVTEKMLNTVSPMSVQRSLFLIGFFFSFSIFFSFLYYF
ncbi:hypothetical protein RV06_GL002295 [Enterococcus haemoperoxidus]|nr:hypothetical protein RV06_GL002295 [Enterococcus haemoperoxidus]